MALEVASVLPPRANVLDVGCGNGFIAHHLQSMLGTTVVGLDVAGSTDTLGDRELFSFAAARGSDELVVPIVIRASSPAGETFTLELNARVH